MELWPHITPVRFVGFVLALDFAAVASLVILVPRLKRSKAWLSFLAQPVLFPRKKRYGVESVDRDNGWPRLQYIMAHDVAEVQRQVDPSRHITRIFIA